MYDHINRHQKGKNMQVQTEAILFNVATVHSTKKNKDYNTLDFILDGVPKKFFVSDEVFNSFLVNTVVKRFQEQGRNPLQYAYTNNMFNRTIQILRSEISCRFHSRRTSLAFGSFHLCTRFSKITRKPCAFLLPKELFPIYFFPN